MIFVGIVTCNREEFFNRCYNSIKKCENVDAICVVNDGISDVEVDGKHTYIKNKKNLGVGKSKNILFKHALQNKKIQHIFIIEDDIVVKDCGVFAEYIKAKDITGIQHFFFGYHGPANRNNVSKGPPRPRYVMDYNTIKIAINANSVGAFCYYSRKSLEKVGLLDENFTNAFEHVDHDYRMAKAGFTTPYWNWPDLANSCDFLDEIECSENSSSIRNREDWMSNIKKGAELFYKKHNYLPAWNNAVPDTSREDLIKILKDIKQKYAR
jgi:GT2 family glycosyltransferase